MKYSATPMDDFNEKARHRAIGATQLGFVVYCVALVLSLIYFVPDDDYGGILLILLFTVAIILVTINSMKAERLAPADMSELGRPQRLIYGLDGFHFEMETPYKATFLKEVELEREMRPLYLIEKIDSGEPFLIYAFCKLPHESFTCTFSFWGGLQFHPFNEPAMVA